MSNPLLPRRVLIADDDPGVVNALRAPLAARGYECLTASSGAQALMMFKQHDVDLIITDLNMPAGGGAALIDRVRRTSRVPIVIITGFSGESQRRAAGYEGVVLLQKPFEAAAIVSMVESRIGPALPAPPAQEDAAA